MSVQQVPVADAPRVRKDVRPFGIRDKIGYMFGDFGNDFTFILQAFFFLVFYTNVVGVKPAHVGTLLLVARIVDAFTDVAMGAVTDRLPAAADGRFRPWIKRIAVPVSVISALMYATWTADWDYTAKIVWMSTTYFLWGSIFYTMVNIPYGSMASVMSPNPDERATLSVFRSTGAQLAVLVIQVLLPLTVYIEVDGQSALSGDRMFIASMIFAVLAVICYAICYVNVQERVVSDSRRADGSQKMSLGATLGSIFTNRSLFGIVIAAWGLLVGNLMLSTMQAYLWLDYFNAGRLQAVASLVGTLAPIGLMFLAPPMARRWGKREVGVLAMLAAGVLCVVLYFMQTQDPYLYIGFYAVLMFTIGIFNFLVWAFITDVIDAQEVRTGVRNDATVYAIYSWARKLGQALAGGLGGWALGWIGYQQTTDGEVITQTPEVLDGVYMLATLVPGAFFLLVALALQFAYPLSKDKVLKNAQTLADRREEARKAERWKPGNGTEQKSWAGGAAESGLKGLEDADVPFGEQDATVDDSAEAEPYGNPSYGNPSYGTKRRSREELRQEALHQVVERNLPIPQVARSLDVDPVMVETWVHNWHKEQESHAEDAGKSSGQAQQPPVDQSLEDTGSLPRVTTDRSTDQRLEELEEALKSLQEENDRLRQAMTSFVEALNKRD